MPRSTPSIEPVSRARAFAIKAHGEQRYGDQRYSFHLEAVAELLHPFGIDAQTVGYLHDVVEDTPLTLTALPSNPLDSRSTR
jgi:(p)ppGpp synthase/HD superfamily hydrolase